jgi:GDPmannose 4,6-dehydratase
VPTVPYRRDESKKVALITGITGQDGSYLAEFLLSKGYEVHGIIRRASSFNTGRIDHIYRDPHGGHPSLFLYNADLTSSEHLDDIMHNVRPDEIYNLGAQSHVRASFDLPEYTSNVNYLGTTRLLRSVYNNGNDCRFYQASTCELYGNSTGPQNELTPFNPANPYAISKLSSFYLIKGFRDWYGTFSVNGILFNHESPRRGETFVTRKITLAITNIKLKKQELLYLGNLDAKRDWGFAPEYVEFMWKMLQTERPGDFVLGTGEGHTVREFLEEAFSYAGLNWEDRIRIDESYKRPKEANAMVSDPRKARSELDWSPKVKFKDLVRIMVDADFRRAGLEPPGEGDAAISRLFPAKWWSVD